MDRKLRGIMLSLLWNASSLSLLLSMLNLVILFILFKESITQLIYIYIISVFQNHHFISLFYEFEFYLETFHKSGNMMLVYDNHKFDKHCDKD